MIMMIVVIITIIVIVKLIKLKIETSKKKNSYKKTLKT